MASVGALYRYPVKGFTPERRQQLSVLESGAVVGDRTLAFAFDNVDIPAPGGHWNPRQFVILKHTAALTRVQVRLDETRGHLGMELDGAVLAEGSLDAGGRERLSAALAEYLASLPDDPLRDRPERAPLRLLGSPPEPTFQDRGPRHISVIGRGSLDALATAMGAAVDERRFRANVIVEGTEPWEELSWSGGEMRLGDAVFDVGQPMIRCVATHAHPERGEADLDIMGALTGVLGQEQPTMGVLASARGACEVVQGAPVTITRDLASRRTPPPLGPVRSAR